ncbi:hypothetical protein PG994_003491 [Apiospora phragmitis]|uniref:Uncharacterized protein n=1 Tax=Apiospora phragmitis TaxID=2905665 RepID=A0ABR1W251_9PEZI
MSPASFSPSSYIWTRRDWVSRGVGRTGHDSSRSPHRRAAEIGKADRIGRSSSRGAEELGGSGPLGPGPEADLCVRPGTEKQRFGREDNDA